MRFPCYNKPNEYGGDCVINEFRRMEYLIKLNEEAKKKQLNYYEVKLKNKISEKELLEFEDKHKVTLPSEYRKFILDYANGIDDKLIDLLSLQQFFSLYKMEEYREGYLSEEFAFDANNLYEAGKKTLIDETVGTISIRKYKGGYDSLVVSGKDRGAIWHANRKKGFGIVRVASSFRKYLDDRIDDRIKTLVEQERFIHTIEKDCVSLTIIEVNQFEQYHELKIVKDNTRKEYQLRYQSDNENLDIKKFTKEMCAGRSVEGVFLFDQAKGFKETQLRGNYYFEELNQSEVLVKTRILESYRDGFSNKYYTRCRLNNFDSDMYIVTTRDISHLFDKEVVFNGQLSALIKGINI